MATEVADQSATATVPAPELQEEQVYQKKPEVEKVEETPAEANASAIETEQTDVPLTEATVATTTGAEEVKDDNVATEETPSAPDAPVSVAEDEAGEKEDEVVVSSEPAADVTEEAAPKIVETSEEAAPKIVETSEEATKEPEQESAEEAAVEKQEKEAEEVTEEPVQEVAGEKEAPADQETKEEEKYVVSEVSRDVDVSEAVPEETAQASVAENVSQAPEEVKEEAAVEEGKPGAETEVAEAVVAEPPVVEDTPKAEEVKEDAVVEEEKPQAETEVAEIVDTAKSVVEDTPKVEDAVPAAEEMSKEVEVPSEEAAAVEPTVEDDSEKTEEKSVETEPVGEQMVVDVEELASTDYPKNVEESKTETPEVTEEIKECNEAPKGNKIAAEQPAEPKEVETIVEEKQNSEPQEEVVKDREIPAAETVEPKESVEKSVETSGEAVETEKKEENGEATRRTSLGDMIKEDSEVKQAEEPAAETAVAAPEEVKSVDESKETDVKTEDTKSEEVNAAPTADVTVQKPEEAEKTWTYEQVTSRDVEVIPPSAATTEEKSAPVVEAEKNGHVEEAQVKAEEKTKDEAATKPASKTILSKVKNSLVKAKKAIIGKSPSSKTITTDASKVES